MRGLRYSTRRAITGILLLCIGLGIAGFTATHLAKDLTLWILGRKTTAHITNLWVEPLNESEEGDLTFAYFVCYEFTTPDGSVITTTSSLAAQEWAELGQGSTVPIETLEGTEKDNSLPVVYFPPYPRHNRIDESQYIPLLALSYVPLLLMTAAALAGARYLLQGSKEP